jgi:hypothetical protein
MKRIVRANFAWFCRRECDAFASLERTCPATSKLRWCSATFGHFAEVFLNGAAAR